MKKITGLKLVAFAAGIIYFSSCLTGGFETSDPTLKEEQAILKAYIDTLITNGRDIDTTSLGVYYVILEEGEGEFAKTGDTLTVGYSGYFVDGKLFDTSQSNNSGNDNFEFILDNPPMIPGWDDAMKVMNKNAKIQFIIPSGLAYGSTGSGIIPPYTTLIFVVKMVDIRPVN